MQNIVTMMVLIVLGLLLMIPISVTLVNIYSQQREIEDISRETLLIKRSGTPIFSPSENVIYGSCKVDIYMPSLETDMGVFIRNRVTQQVASMEGSGNLVMGPNIPLPVNIDVINEDLCNTSSGNYDLELTVLKGRHVIHTQNLFFRNSGTPVRICVRFNASDSQGGYVTGPIDANVLIRSSTEVEFTNYNINGCKNILFDDVESNTFYFSIIKPDFYAFVENNVDLSEETVYNLHIKRIE